MNRLQLNGRVLSIWAGALVCAIASGQAIVPIEQDRSISTGGFVEACGFARMLDSFTRAEDFGLFDEKLFRIITCETAEASALAIQQSETGAQSLSVSGLVASRSNAEVAGMILATAGSTFDVVFELTDRSRFRLEGNLSGDTPASESSSWGASVILSANPGPEPHEIIRREVQGNGLQPPKSIDIAERGVLEPGTYRLQVFADVIVDDPHDPVARVNSAFAIAFNLAPACPADLDGDDSVGLSDLGILLSNFGTPEGALPEDGDLDRDGDVDLSDLSRMLAFFGEQCS